MNFRSVNGQLVYMTEAKHFCNTENILFYFRLWYCGER